MRLKWRDFTAAVLVSALFALAGTAGAVVLAMSSQHPAPATTPTLTIGCENSNLTGLWNATNVYLTYTCVPGGPVFTATTSGNYLATVTSWDSVDARDIFIFVISPISHRPPSSCEGFQGAEAIVSDYNESVNGVVPITSFGDLQGYGYSYCEDVAPGATHVNGFDVTWTWDGS